MFDDPGKKLKWLEQELRAAEEPDTCDEIYEEFDNEFDDLMDQADTFLEEEELEENPQLSRGFAFSRPRKNPAVDYPRMVYDDEVFDEDAAVLVSPREKKRVQKTAQEKPVVNRNLKGLVILAFLEILGILAIIGWWLQWLI